MKTKPQKPTPDFPLFAHGSGKWAKKVGGKLRYFGRWEDPATALKDYQAWLQQGGQKQKQARKSNGIKPAKPYPNYPLFAHGSGQWAKKINGRIRYFGVWADPDAALAKYNAERVAWETGQTPNFVEGITIEQLCNEFLHARQARVDAGEMTERCWDDYQAECDRTCRVLGKRTAVRNLLPSDFARLRADIGRGKNGNGVGAVSKKCYIRRIRAIFNWGQKNGTLDHPVRWGTEFEPPKKRELRQARNERGSAKFTAEEIRELLDIASPQMRAMILLGINCGFGNRDCAYLTNRHLELDTGWHNYPRQKTAVKRRASLWPETVAAIRYVLREKEAIANEVGFDLNVLYPSGEAIGYMRVGHTNSVRDYLRKHPECGERGQRSWEIYGWAIAEYLRDQVRARAADSDAKRLIFRTTTGEPWIRYQESKAGKKYHKDSIAGEFSKLVKKSSINATGRDLTFYSLRHTFQTIGDESGHPIAVKFMMGHADDDFDISTVYREEVSDNILHLVCSHIRDWLQLK